MHGGKLEEGVELLREAWVIGEEVFDAGHPTHLTDGANLAHALMKQGSLKEALTQIELVEKMAREGFSVDHPILAQTLGHRAQILHKKGDHKAAEVCYRQVIQGLERAAGPRSHNVVAYMALLAGMYREVGRLDEAEAMLPDLRARVEGNGSLASEIEKLAADIAGSRAGKKK